MSYESLGAVGSAPTLDGRAIAELELGIAFLKIYVGDPPDGARLDIVYNDHELGQYATIGLYGCNGSLEAEEWKYYRLCERALFAFDRVMAWPDLAEVLFFGEEDGGTVVEEGQRGT